jgi:hypothetical protein
MPTYYAQVTYTGNGSTTSYAIPFSYIDSSHVKAYINGTLTSAFTISTSTLTFTSAPANGATVRIERQTPLDARLVDFADGSVLTEADLDRSANQNFFIAQEVADDAINNLAVDTDDKYNAQSKVIKNLANPVNANDAVNKTYLENTWLSTADKATLTNLNSNIASVNTVNTNIASVNTVASDLNEAVSEINTVAVSIANVDTVGTNIANVNTVAGNNANINTVASANSNITTVAGANANITAVAGQITPTNNISTVAGAVANIGTVATNIANVNLVGGSIANVNTVASANANITTVATANTNIGTVAGAIANVNSVGGSIANVNSVAGNSTNINLVVANSANINTVASANANITTVAGIAGAISSVASNASNISTVATDIAKVITAANDLNEAISEIDTVANSIANVDTVGGAIANVNTLATNIANVNIVGNNIGTVNDFSNRYRVASADPTTSKDAGDLVFNTTANALKYYNGTTWEAIVAGGLTDIVQDGTPQLGGSLDVNGNSIVSTSNANINITPHGTGKVVLDGISYPTSDGTANQYLKTDGAGVLSFGTVDLTTLSATNLTSGTVPSARLSLTSSDLPTVPTTKGGTGLTTLGTAGQALVVNGAGTALTYANSSSAEVYGFTFIDADGDGYKESLQVTTTNNGADSISKSSHADFRDVVFSGSGYTFSISVGDLILTL